MKNTPSLSFSKLACNRNGRQLFNELHCALDTGQCLYITGTNGAGKTSLLRMLCGLMPIESGAITWHGQTIHAQRQAFHADLCYVGHQNALQESMTVNENLIFAAALVGQALNTTNSRDVLAQFGVQDCGQHLVRHLSQGQKRRVALSRLVFSTAKLWVLDEPFVALDETGIHSLIELLGHQLERGGNVVLTSHQQIDMGRIPVRTMDLDACA